MKNILVTGSAGFIGTNLVKRFLKQPDNFVIGIDNFSSSSKWKSEIFIEYENYKFIEGDICDKEFLNEVVKDIEINEIYNLACPASPPRYLQLPLETINASTNGVRNLLEVAQEHNAKILHTSTSEIYGDPLVHPQTEEYRGNVNTIGPRSCYDESKRLSETLCYEYSNKFNVDVRIVRIFNTYGPYMDQDDGRVVTNFLKQALNNEEITIYGDGSQTRSFQYINDLLDMFELLMSKEDGYFGPINVGNPNEFTIRELAEEVIKITQSDSEISYHELPQDDPKQRQPFIEKAKSDFGWEPKIQLTEGLEKTIEYLKSSPQS